MNLIERVIGRIENRRERVLSGKINCIPTKFTRFRNDFPGTEQGKYYIVTGNTKAGKTQIANFLFIYNNILYSYYHPDKVRLKIFYFPFEETQEKITLRFMSFLLYVLSDKRIRKSPQQLESVHEDTPIEPEVIDLLKSEEYQKILNYFEDTITFVPERNPSGLWYQAKAYAESHGTTHYKTLEIKNKDNSVANTLKVFDYYTPDDPEEYVLFFIDHAGLVETEKELDLRASIGKLSEYCYAIRNKYNYIPVLIQQQSVETSNLDAFKANKIRPTQAGLADNKSTGKDATVMLGITNPHYFELPNYYGYDIGKLKNYARFLEVVLNREGESNSLIGLYFDGAVNYFEELPKPFDAVGMGQIYDRIESNKENENLKLE